MIAFWIVMGGILLVALAFVLYPLQTSLQSRNAKFRTVGICLFVIALALGIYDQLGNHVGVRNAIFLQTFNEENLQTSDHHGLLTKLTEGLQQQLEQHHEDPITWTLLGKIYFTLKDYSAARDAFATAYQQLPTDPDILVDYTTAYYLASGGVIDNDLQALIDKVAALPPTTTSLSLLANIAIDKGNIPQAIQYWREMQALVPKDSALYQELELTIKFANEK